MKYSLKILNPSLRIMFKTHLSKWCWIICLMLNSFKTIFKVDMQNNVWNLMMMFNNVKNPPFKMMLNKMFISDQLCSFQQLLSPLSPLFFGTLSVNLGEQDKRSGFGLIEKWKLKITLQKFNLYCNGKVKNIYGQPEHTR